MADNKTPSLLDELLSTLDTAGKTEEWVERNMGGTAKVQDFDEAFSALTLRLLVDQAQIAGWEHLLVTVAIRSTKSNSQQAYSACDAAIAEFSKMMKGDSLKNLNNEQIVTLASALTLVLTAQRKLRQSTENAIRLLCDRFPKLVPEMAQRCQDIWQRRGQMSGYVGLFVWDTRKNEWRLEQDFKSQRPNL